MSGKRSAAEYITKENGSIFGEAAGEEKPRIATAAQMATRKTATPRGRLNRAGTPQRRFPPSNNTNSNPFAGAVQQTFGAVGSEGMVFGGQPQSNATQQQSSGFNFSASTPSGTNPFENVSFGNVNGNGPFGTTSHTSNSDDEARVKRVNTGDENAQTMRPVSAASNQSTFGFGASQTQNQQAQQNANNPFGGLFGTSTQNSSPAQSPTPSFSFGQSSTAQQNQTPSVGFGQNSIAQHNQTSSFFGQNNLTSTTSEQQSAKPAFSFGTSASNAQEPAPSFSFGGSRSPAPQQNPSGSVFGLGGNANLADKQQQSQQAFTFGVQSKSVDEQPPSKPAFTFGAPSQNSTEQTKPAFSFGGQQKPTTEQEPAKPAFSFGSQPKTAPGQQIEKPAFSFGATSLTASQQQATSPAFSFGASGQHSPEETTSKPAFTFGGPVQSNAEQQLAPKPAFSFGAPSISAEKQQVTFPNSGIKFGQAASDAAQPKTPANTFSFGRLPDTAGSDGSLETPAPPSGSDLPVFSADVNRTPGSNLFGSPAKSVPHNDALTPHQPKFATLENSDSVPRVNNSPLMFGAGANSQPDASPKAPLFGQAPAAKPPADVAPTANSTPALNWGQAKNSTSATDEPEKPAVNPFAGLFAKASTTPSAATSTSILGQNEKDEEHVTAPGELRSQAPSSGGLFTPAPPKSLAPPQEAPATINQEVLPAAAPKKTLFGTLSQPAPAALAEKSTSDVSTSPGPPVQGGSAPIQRQVYTKSPSRVPSFLNGEGFKEYDNNYRLRALNKEFQKKIAAWDADRNDIENLIRHYVSARAAVGGDIGLYQRAIAGTKRRPDEPEEELEVPVQYKKAKFTSSKESDTTSISGATGAKHSIPEVSPPPRRVKVNAPAENGPISLPEANVPKSESAAATKAASPAKATSLFSNMIPASSPKATSPLKATPVKPANPFAGVSLLPEENKPSFSWGNTNNAGSTPKAPTNFFGQPSGSTTPQKSPPKNGFFGVPSSTASFGGSNSNKRKSGSEVEENEVTSEEDSRKKRSRLETKNAANIFGSAAGAQKRKQNGPFEEDSPDEAEEDTDPQTGDDPQDSDFAPNADDSDSDDSNEDEAGEESDDIAGVTQQEESETSRASDEDHSQEIQANPNRGKSLFDRIEKPQQKSERNTPPTQPAVSSSSAIKWPTPLTGLSPDAPAFSPITPASKPSPYKPSKTFNFTPTPVTKSPAEPGASVLQGGSTNAPFSKFEGMFGSRPSTPEPEKPRTFNAPTSAPTGDHTWKQGSPIRFNANVVPPSPQPDKPATSGTSLFGKPASAQATESEGGSLGFNFGKSSQPSYLEAATHLAPESGVSSAISSRATSPGLTDNESVATNDTTEEVQNDPQQNLLETRPGEEDEKVLIECRAKALLMAKGDRAIQLKMKPDFWTSIGLGNFRVLQHKKTGRVRVILRAEPGANVVLNSYLRPDIEYAIRDQGKNSGAVNARFDYQGGLDHVVLKVRSPELAQQIADLLNEHKNVV